MESMIKGKKSASPLMTAMSFGSFNKAFKPNRTDFDWLSRDHEQVKKYIDDPMCGTIFSSGFFTDILQGIMRISNPETVKKVPVDLPVYFFSGAHCPVGENTKGVKKVYTLFENAGIKDLACKFYENGRHEMLNEINKDEVYKDVLGWIDTHMA
jgi:alpha-beta hydrolase superfamily lysophospholipase